jgi:hypothetical protein
MVIPTDVEWHLSYRQRICSLLPNSGYVGVFPQTFASRNLTPTEIHRVCYGLRNKEYLCLHSSHAWRLYIGCSNNNHALKRGVIITKVHTFHRVSLKIDHNMANKLKKFKHEKYSTLSSRKALGLKNTVTLENLFQYSRSFNTAM